MSDVGPQICSCCNGNGYTIIEKSTERFRMLLRLWGIIIGTIVIAAYCVVRGIQGHLEMAGILVSIIGSLTAFHIRTELKNWDNMPMMKELVTGKVSNALFNMVSWEIGRERAIIFCDLLILIRDHSIKSSEETP